MSIHPRSWPEPAKEITQAIKAIYRGKRQAPLPVRVRDELGELFADAEFAGAFGVEGRPGWSPGRLALISVLQDLNRLELAGECVGAALEALSAAAPGWVGQVLEVGGWADRYRARIDSWRLPTSATKRKELAVAYGTDGYALVAACYAPFSPAWLRELPAVQALRVMLVQNYMRTTDKQGREVVVRRRPLEEGGQGLRRTDGG
jgi:hypothetical protein